MEFSSTRWLSELEFGEHNNIHSYQMNPFVGDYSALQQSISSISNITNYNGSSCDLMVEEKPLKLTKTSDYVLPPPPPNHHQPSSRILSFETDHSSNHMNSIFSPKEVTSGNRRGNKRAHHPLNHQSKSQAQEHILAERRRREKLTQRFVALSALVPGLKKMDKASVLGDAIKHIKCLQERVKEFEEQKKERTVESVVVVNKSQLILAEESSSCSNGESDSSTSPLPDIEVRVSDKNIMVKIVCENRKGHVTKILAEIEKLHLSIINNSVFPFGATLDITVITRKEREFDMTLVDLAKNLRTALSKFT